MAIRNLIPPPLPILIAGSLAISMALSKSQDTTTGLQKTFADSAVSQDNQNILTLVDPGHYSAKIAVISERPLFSETRRNPELVSSETDQGADLGETAALEKDENEFELAEEEQIEEPPKPPGLSYLGYMEQDGTPSALIRLNEKNEEEWVYAGTEIEGWVLKSISKSRIYLTQRRFEHFVDINL